MYEDHYGDGASGLDLSRDGARDHLAFGAGPHACLGAWLARLEIRTVLQALIRRAPGTGLAGPEPMLGGTAFLRNVEHLPLTLDPMM